MPTPKKKAVIFDMGGVLVTPPQWAINNYEKSLGLPRMFIQGVMMKGMPNNAFCQLERGELTLSQFFSAFTTELHEAAGEGGVELPADFSVQQMFQQMQGGQVVGVMIKAVRNLRKHGVKTCILTNNWLDDTAVREGGPAAVLVLFRRLFDLVVESCRVGLRKPDPAIFHLTCRQLGVQPQEAVFLDDIGNNVKAARQLGITTILVRDFDKAVRELEEAVGLELTRFPPPAVACKPEEVPHCYITLKTGIKLHYVDVGDGPVVILCHGFPESWYSWRYQIPALSLAGYRVIALDQRGYGDSSCPTEIEAYTHEELTGDIIGLMNALDIPQATVVGHDWGGAIVWALSLHYPDRIRGVAGVNTPFFPANPEGGSPLERMKKNPRQFDYQLYFQQPGVAEAEFEKNLERTLNAFFRSSKKEDWPFDRKGLGTDNVRARGGMLVGFPDVIPLSLMMKQEEIEYYVQQFGKSGFRGPLNWYRNVDANWRWNNKTAGRKAFI
ncbi:PREDICTED: bifunctional epoxide hydrolase 2-like [Branchiostoma belcheri]|uniref:Bifunctional epoxide hydrolase 2-like n=1 Tax=Branchiostoma belcheri TaxID=7741 RepID=A0A6P4YG80_BRABE|nr:PREDICTED: bifunctional epoxide hydrolase 2-like [Branchiostoma belcheri]